MFNASWTIHDDGRVDYLHFATGTKHCCGTQADVGETFDWMLFEMDPTDVVMVGGLLLHAMLLADDEPPFLPYTVPPSPVAHA